MPQGRSPGPRSAPLEAVAEDFVYHLYRGTELLADGRYDGAREELERALRHQPTDPAAQDLLARLYFKLGVYPRAIELYQEIIRQFPERSPLRINLALAFLKTGQMRDAVTQLLYVIEQEPAHTRAWGYLGLAWSRLGEYAKAREAFTRAGHEGMARRMEEQLEAQYAPPSRPSMAPPPPTGEEDTAAVAEAQRALAAPRAPSPLPAVPGAGVELVGSAPTAFDDAERAMLESPPDRAVSWHPAPRSSLRANALTPGGDAPVTLAALAERTRIAPEGGALELTQGSLVVVGGCATRLPRDYVGVGLSYGEPVRHDDGTELVGDPLLIWLRAGWAALPARRDAVRTLINLHDERLVVRERALLAFEGSLMLERHASSPGICALTGRGRLVLESPAAPRAIALPAGGRALVPRARLLALSAGLTFARTEDESIEVSGEGTVLVVLGAPPASREGSDG